MSLYTEAAALHARLAQLYRLWDKADDTGQPTGPISDEISQVQTQLVELGRKEEEDEGDQVCAAPAPVG